MKLMHYGALCLLSTGIGAGLAFAQSDALPSDQPIMVDGIETVCTGGASDAREDSRWAAYPFRLEFVGKNGEFLGDEAVTVSGNGHTVSVRCKGPWVLMKLPAGRYRVDMDVAEAGHKSIAMNSPGHSVMRFPEAGGAVSDVGRPNANP